MITFTEKTIFLSEVRFNKF